MYSIRLDWLAFSWKASDTFTENEFDLFMDRFPELKAYYDDCQFIRVCSPMKFYECTLAFNENFRLSWRVSPLPGKSGDRNLGVNVSIPAHGLEFFFDLMGYDTEDVFSAIDDLVKRGCSFSRLDIAYDDYDKILSPSQYGIWFVKRQLQTHFHKGHYIATDSKDGGSFYLGSRKSGNMIRIYDKSYESRDSDGTPKIDSIRYEIEVHGDNTKKFVDYMLEYHSFPSLQVALSEYINNVVVEGENRKDHRDTLPEWELFLNALTPSLTQSSDQPVKATCRKDTSDRLMRKITWYQRYILPSLKSLAMIIGWDSVLNSIMNSPCSVDHKILMALYSNESSRYDEAFDDGTGLGKDFSNCW